MKRIYNLDIILYRRLIRWINREQDDGDIICNGFGLE